MNIKNFFITFVMANIIIINFLIYKNSSHAYKIMKNKIKDNLHLQLKTFF